MDPQVNYLLSLPDEVLMNDVFPQLNVPYLLYLCQINVRFSNICQNDYLWQILTERDFGITSIPPGLNSWRETYMFYHRLLTEPIFAMPYVENELLQQRQTGTINPIYQMVVDKYKAAIIPISMTDQNGNPVKFTIHLLQLYDPYDKYNSTCNIIRSNKNITDRRKCMEKYKQR